MHDTPPAADLLDAAARVLRDDVIPALSGATAYQARIVASLVATVARELRSDGPRREVQSLAALVGGEGDAAALNRRLAAAIADGSRSIDEPAVLAHLIATTLAELRVDQPRHPRLADYA